MRLASRPMSMALAAGTTSISAEMKSASVMPYFSLSFSITWSLMRSLSPASPTGQLPSSTFRPSPVMASLRGFLPCSPPRWGSRSVMTNLGSSPTPSATSTTVPSFMATTPRISRGMVTHWYLRMPP